MFAAPPAAAFWNDRVEVFASENITYDTLAGRLMKIDLETGTVLGSMESPGHLLTVAADGAIYVASLTGNIFKWSPHPAWPQRAR